MSNRLNLTKPSNDVYEARIGGGALIGGVERWPTAPDGSPLVLIASLPDAFISQYTDVQLSDDFITSVFSFYSDKDYFLDEIAYHGNPEEFLSIKSGFTKVIRHRAGQEISQSVYVPAHRLEVRELILDEEDCGSRIGGKPFMLQNEKLDLAGLSYVLQFRSSDFPEKYSDIFGLSDALGYLYLDRQRDREGMFFVQTT